MKYEVKDRAKRLAEAMGGTRELLSESEMSQRGRVVWDEKGIEGRIVSPNGRNLFWFVAAPCTCSGSETGCDHASWCPCSEEEEG